VGALVRSIVRLTALASVAAWLADRWLRDRAAGAQSVPIRSSVVVDAPIERVWAVLADIERQPAWMNELTSVRLTTPPPVGVGTRAVGRVQAFGIALDDPIEIVAFEPPTRYAIRHDGLVTGGGEIRLAAGADGSTTEVTWEETLVAPVLPHLGSLILAAVFGPIFQRDLERLAALVEDD